MNSEHVEVLRHMKETIKAIAPTEVAALDAAIASLSAPQPPAEAQPCGCGEATCTEPWEPGCGLGKSEQHAAVDEAMVGRAVAGYAAGPWAAFSPEASREAHRERMRAALQAAIAPQPASDGGFTAADMMDARQEGRKEAQQPAAVDGAIDAALRFLGGLQAVGNAKAGEIARGLRALAQQGGSDNA